MNNYQKAKELFNAHLNANGIHPPKNGGYYEGAIYKAAISAILEAFYYHANTTIEPSYDNLKSFLENPSESKKPLALSEFNKLIDYLSINKSKNKSKKL